MLEIEMQGVHSGSDAHTRTQWRAPQQAITATVP